VTHAKRGGPRSLPSDLERTTRQMAFSQPSHDYHHESPTNLCASETRWQAKQMTYMVNINYFMLMALNWAQLVIWATISHHRLKCTRK